MNMIGDDQVQVTAEAFVCPFSYLIQDHLGD